MIKLTDELGLQLLLYAGNPPSEQPDPSIMHNLRQILKFDAKPGSKSRQWQDWYQALRAGIKLMHPDAEEQDYTDLAVAYCNWCRQRMAAGRIRQRRANAILKGSGKHTLADD